MVFTSANYIRYGLSRDIYDMNYIHIIQLLVYLQLLLFLVVSHKSCFPEIITQECVGDTLVGSVTGDLHNVLHVASCGNIWATLGGLSQ